jgi:hypothetical protein
MSEKAKIGQLSFKTANWTPAVVDNPWLATTENYFAAYAVAKSANQRKAEVAGMDSRIRHVNRPQY